jgi:hypothetical protein
MNSSQSINSITPDTSPTPSSSREGATIRQYVSASDERASSIDEKRSLKRSSSESATSLLLEARELESQPEPRTTPPENLVPRRTKIIYVALYFFLNLSLTLSNKSVLSQVSASLFFFRMRRVGHFGRKYPLFPDRVQC